MSSDAVLAFDLTSDSPALLEAGVSWATRLGSQLTILHVVTDEQIERYRADGRSEGPYLDVILDQLRDDIHGRLVDTVGPERARDVHIEILTGDPAALIPGHTGDLGAEALLIGVRSRSRVAKLVFGSAAQSIILLSPCPVICLPAKAP